MAPHSVVSPHLLFSVFSLPHTFCLYPPVSVFLSLFCPLDRPRRPRCPLSSYGPRTPQCRPLVVAEGGEMSRTLQCVVSSEVISRPAPKYTNVRTWRVWILSVCIDFEFVAVLRCGKAIIASRRILSRASHPWMASRCYSNSSAFNSRFYSDGYDTTFEKQNVCQPSFSFWHIQEDVS